MAKDNEKNLENEDLENEDVQDQPTEEEGAGKDSGSDSKPADKGAAQKAARTFTQEQVNKMMTREKNQGRAAVYKELGIDPNNKKAVVMVKALIDSQKSDEQKEAEKNAEEQQKVQEANLRALTAEAKAEAMQLGCKPQFVDDLVTLSLAKMSDGGDLKTIIGEFKTKYPMWFAKEDAEDKDGGKKTGQKGTGSSVKTQEKGKNKKGEEQSLGQRLAAQRRKSSGKTSYWGNNKK